MDYQVISNDETMAVNPTVIKVIGAGGGGSNAVNRMMECGIQGVDFIVANTDLQALQSARASVKLPIGSKITGGLGAGGKPEVGEQAAAEDTDLITNTLKGANMVFVTAGMGGGTGTGSAPIIAKIAKDLEALTVGIVTTPFEFEGPSKMKLAQEGLRKLREVVDTLIVIPNQNLLKLVDTKTTVTESFMMADDILRQAVQGISDLITKPGFVNIDFADVRSTMLGQGDALMGVGVGSGETRAVDAALRAISNPLLAESNSDGVTRILISVTAPKDFSLTELQEIIKMVSTNASDDIHVIFGTTFNADESDDSVTVTVIATGFAKDTSLDDVLKTSDGFATKKGYVDGRSAGAYVSSAELNSGLNIKQPVLPGLGPRNAPMTASKPVEEQQVKQQSFESVRVRLPNDNTDLDEPTYLRNQL